VAAALLMQEQGKAEAQRVAKLRERGIAADPRPAMDLSEALLEVDRMLSTTITAMLEEGLRPWQDTVTSEGASPRVGRHEPSRACTIFTGMAYAFTFWMGVGGYVLYYTKSPHAAGFAAVMGLGAGIMALGAMATCM